MFLAKLGKLTTVGLLAIASCGVGLSVFAGVGAVETNWTNAPKLPAKEPKQRQDINVLLVNGRPHRDRFEQATEYLRLALNPFGNGPAPDSSKILVRVISTAQFGNLALQDLREWDSIFLCDVSRVTAAETEKLEAFVRGGGGIVFCLGPQVDLDAYSTQLYRKGKGLLPVRLLHQRPAKEDHFFRLAVPDDSFKKPPLAAFAAEADRRTLLAPKFRNFVCVDQPDPQSKARIIASFEESPMAKGGQKAPAGIAMLEWRPFTEGKDKSGGRVVLLTSTLNMEWNNWPGSPSYGAAMHELLRFVSADRPTRAPR